MESTIRSELGWKRYGFEMFKNKGKVDTISLVFRHLQVDQKKEGDSPSNRAPNQGEFCKTLEENVLKMLEQWT